MNRLNSLHNIVYNSTVVERWSSGLAVAVFVLPVMTTSEFDAVAFRDVYLVLVLVLEYTFEVLVLVLVLEA